MTFIRLAPDPDDLTLKLSRDESLSEADQAFRRAKKAQSRLVARLGLTERLYDPGMVNRAKLRSMAHQAEEQVRRAQEVVDALLESIAALERYSPTKDTQPTEHEEHQP